MSLVQRAFAQLERLLEIVICLCLLAMTAVTLLDVVGRYLLNSPLAGGYEIAEMLMGLTVFAALPLVSRTEGHLTVSLLTDGLSGTTRRIHRIAMLIVSQVALAFIAWRMGVQSGIVAHSRATTGSLQIPLWPIVWMMSALAWCAASLVFFMTVQAISEAKRGAGDRSGRAE